MTEIFNYKISPFYNIYKGKVYDFIAFIFNFELSRKSQIILRII